MLCYSKLHFVYTKRNLLGDTPKTLKNNPQYKPFLIHFHLPFLVKAVTKCHLATSFRLCCLYSLKKSITNCGCSPRVGRSPSTPFIAKRGMHTCGVHTSPLPSSFLAPSVPSRVARPQAVSVLPLDLTTTTSRRYAVTVLFLFHSQFSFRLGVLFAIS